MSAEFNEYSGRLGMYRLLAAFPNHTNVLDEVLDSPDLRDTVSQLVAVAFGGFVLKCEGDIPSAVNLIKRELRVVEDLAKLDQ